MDRKKKEKLKNILSKKRDDLVEKIKHIRQDALGQSQREASGDLSGYAFDMADVASDNFEREIALGLAANEQELLYQIDDALKRLKDKDFGKCQTCSKVITLKRLSAVPYAQLCISCQKQEDKLSKE
ncbi:MAG: TraR/DksA family transcriptional regulator [Candidatus Omnitrophica bacterium]|nr:TraR/DksA family transcriptional regulator [Candidatus Omnitrophota bacterium]